MNMSEKKIKENLYFPIKALGVWEGQVRLAKNALLV